jgi:hypothetical protein
MKRFASLLIIASTGCSVGFDDGAEISRIVSPTGASELDAVFPAHSLVRFVLR